MFSWLCTSPAFRRTQHSICATPTGNHFLPTWNASDEWEAWLRTALKVNDTALCCSSNSLLTSKLLHGASFPSFFGSLDLSCSPLCMSALASLIINLLQIMFRRKILRELISESMLTTWSKILSMESSERWHENQPEIHLKSRFSTNDGLDLLNSSNAARLSHRTSGFSASSKYCRDHKMLDSQHDRSLSDKAKVDSPVLSGEISNDCPPAQKNSMTAFWVLHVTNKKI